MNLKKLEEILKENNQPAFRLKQIKKAIFTDGISYFSEITTISKDLRRVIKKEFQWTSGVHYGRPTSTSGILSFEAEKILVSSDRRSIKALLKLEDGNLIETVLISPKPARLASTSNRPRESRRGVWSACISSQVGCPLGCGFCATGRGGFKRNLTSEEITDQVLFWRQYLVKGSKSLNPKRLLEPKLNNIVFMGMGEPFLNWEAVRQSLENLIDPDLFGFGSRSISVSTAGIPEGIEKMATKFPQINLAVSLHFATNEMRDEYMPINKKYNLTELRNSLRNYFSKCNRKVFIEYILLENINDSIDDAKNLIKYLKSIGKLQLLHVNLIRYNSADKRSGLPALPAGGSQPKRPKEAGPLVPSDSGVAREFKDYLSRNGISVTIRKSLGTDIQGACGQLAARQAKNENKSL
jgi:adenine C2-methylase RlmN of 23S rRNA A2503 and tRNA A37